MTRQVGVCVLIPGEPYGNFVTNIIRGDLASDGGSFFNNVDAFLLRVQGRALLYQRQGSLILCVEREDGSIYMVVQAIVTAASES